MAAAAVNVQTKSDDVLHTYESFDIMGIDTSLLRSIYAYGFEHPSMIQQKAIVPMSKGRDMLAQSQSGTGKTATFLIGSLMQISNDFTDSPKILILTPTDFAFQINSWSSPSYKPKVNLPIKLNIFL